MAKKIAEEVLQDGPPAGRDDVKPFWEQYQRRLHDAVLVKWEHLSELDKTAFADTLDEYSLHVVTNGSSYFIPNAKLKR